jgi:hypothetical protein
VIYILYREYLHKNPGLTSLSPEDPKYQRYLERRLRQLYPTKGYEGMMRDAVEELRQDRVAWAAYQRELRDWKNSVGVMACTGTSVIDPDTGESCFPPAEPDPGTSSDPTVDPSWDGQVEHAVPDDNVIPTLQMEIDTLQMDQTEINQLYYQESLADGSYYSRYGEVIVASTGARATIDDLIRAAGEGRTMPSGNATIQVNPVVIAAVVSHSLLIGWKAWRAYVAAGRAEKKANEFYPALERDDTRRDAYRHIYWNMQMRRECNQFWAKKIGDLYELYGSNTHPGHQMDYHNNAIGYDVKYHTFRGRWWDDMWNRTAWANRVRAYVDHQVNGEFTNGEFISEWSNNAGAVSSQSAEWREKLVPAAKYIYFKL